MSKIKMRCIACGKWFQSANAKEVTCPDCMQKARKEKMAAKNAPPTPAKPVTLAGSAPVRPPVPSKPKPAQRGTNQWLDKLDDVKIAEPDQPPRPKSTTPPIQRNNRNGPASGPGDMRGPNNYNPRPYPNERGPQPYRDERHPNSFRGPGAYRVTNDTRLSPTLGQRPQYPRQPIEGPPGPGIGRGPAKPWQKDPAEPKPKPRPKATRPPAPPKPKREKVPPPAPFAPTPEQIKQVEERYQILAQPNEFDGIRTQIAQEIAIPKKAVKKIIKDFREHQHIPSWWELQVYKGSTEEMERIKAAYQPYLPIPPVGVHKKIAETLGLKPGTVYQAIKTVRVELNLPQYNDPILHDDELPAQTSQPVKQTEQHNPEQTRPLQTLGTGSTAEAKLPVVE